MVKLTPKGLSVRPRQRAISLVRSSGVGCVSAVMKPSAPALATAATSSARPTHCTPPWTIGWSTPTSSVNRVLIILALTLSYPSCHARPSSWGFQRQDPVAAGKCPTAAGEGHDNRSCKNAGLYLDIPVVALQAGERCALRDQREHLIERGGWCPGQSSHLLNDPHKPVEAG